jgi:hypothetical protein
MILTEMLLRYYNGTRLNGGSVIVLDKRQITQMYTVTVTVNILDNRRDR